MNAGIDAWQRTSGRDGVKMSFDMAKKITNPHSSSMDQRAHDDDEKK